MTIKNYTTKTASLKATTADIRKLSSKTVSAETLSADTVFINYPAAENPEETQLVNLATLVTPGAVTEGSTSLVSGDAVAEAIEKAVTINNIKIGESEDNLEIINKTVSIPVASPGGETAGLVTLGSRDELQGNFSATSTDAATVASVSKAIASLQSEITAIKGTGVNYMVAESLPEASEKTLGWIYLIKDESSVAGEYIEYLCVNKGTLEAPLYTWEPIASTENNYSSYAKTITLGTNNSVNVADNIANLTGKVVTSIATANGVQGSVNQETGAATITIQDASDNEKGIVQLYSSEVKATDTGSDKAVTIKGLADTRSAINTDINTNISTAINALDAEVADGPVSVTQEDGKITNVSVDLSVKFNKTDSDSTLATDATVKGAYDAAVEDAKTTLNGYDTEGNNITSTVQTVKVYDSRGNTVTGNDLWGTKTSIDSDGIITISHDYINWKENSPGSWSAWNSSVTAVKDNKAYSETDAKGNPSGNPIANIQTEIIKNCNYMFYQTDLASFNSDLSKLTNGNSMFGHTKLTSFDIDLPSLTNGHQMFYYCTDLASFNSDLSKLTNGDYMFSRCTKLTSFDIDLPSLTNGFQMFFQSESLKTFNSDLQKLSDGSQMFYYTNLASFNLDLPSLTNGYRMFSHCESLTSFNGDLSSLTTARQMFYGTALESFNGDLSSLTNGSDMFDRTTLDTESVECIADTINDLSDDKNDGSFGWGTILISISNSTPNEDEETAFNTISSKGWTVYVNGNSSSNMWTPTASTNLTDEEQSTHIPFYAKPIQVTEDEAKYVDSNNNYYNIIGAQFIYGDDLSTYGTFTSYEHAIEEICLAFDLTKYIKPTKE